MRNDTASNGRYGWGSRALVWCCFALHRLLASLPWPVYRRLGKSVGRLVLRALPTRRRVARENIARCFSELDEASLRALLRKHSNALGIGIAELGLAWYAPDTKLAALYELQGADHLDAALASGNGVILLCGHFTTLDVANRLLALTTEHAGVWRPLGHPVADRWIRRGRERGAAALFEKTQFRGALRWLRSGRALMMAADQADQSDAAVVAPFLGHPATTNVTAWRLSQSTGCIILPMLAGRDDAGRYRLIFDAPLNGLAALTEDAAAAALNEAIESQIRRFPDQYYWVHRRFKSIRTE